MAKKFDFGENIYYFNIRSTGQSSITIKRKNKHQAIQSFLGYKDVGKDVEWLGKWDGKKFTETSLPK